MLSFTYKYIIDIYQKYLVYIYTITVMCEKNLFFYTKLSVTLLQVKVFKLFDFKLQVEGELEKNIPLGLPSFNNFKESVGELNSIVEQGLEKDDGQHSPLASELAQILESYHRAGDKYRTYASQRASREEFNKLRDDMEMMVATVKKAIRELQENCKNDHMLFEQKVENISEELKGIQRQADERCKWIAHQTEINKEVLESWKDLRSK